MDDSWRANLIEDGDGIRRVLATTRRVAVLGIKTEKAWDQPAYYVAQYLVQAGLDVVPVPVYYPEATEILGQPVVRRLADIVGPVDLVDVFRRPQDLPAHLDDLLALNPKCVWLQQGIRHSGVAEALARAGIAVVQDRCLMVDYRQMRP